MLGIRACVIARGGERTHVREVYLQSQFSLILPLPYFCYCTKEITMAVSSEPSSAISRPSSLLRAFVVLAGYDLYLIQTITAF